MPSSNSSYPSLLRERWDIICSNLRCRHCRDFVRLYCRDSSTHVICCRCSRPMSVVQILSSNPELCQWYQRWGSARLRPIGGGIARRTSGTPSATPRSSHSCTTQQSVVHNQEMVDSAGRSSLQPPPQERPSSSSIIPRKTDPLASFDGSRNLATPPHKLPPPDHLNFCIELVYRLPFRGQPEPPLPAVPEAVVEAFTTVTVTSEHVEGIHGILRRVCPYLCAKANLEVGDQAKELPCRHLLIHAECFVSWWQSRCGCPVCGYELPLRWRMMSDGGMQFLSCPFEEENDREIEAAGRRRGGWGHEERGRREEGQGSS